MTIQVPTGGFITNLPAFCATLERICIETVEQGKMTKDLSLLISKAAPWQIHLLPYEFNFTAN